MLYFLSGQEIDKTCLIQWHSGPSCNCIWKMAKWINMTGYTFKTLSIKFKLVVKKLTWHGWLLYNGHKLVPRVFAPYCTSECLLRLPLQDIDFGLFKCCRRSLVYISFFCSRDYLKITNEKDRVFGKYCGHRTGKTVLVSGKYALIKVHSNRGIQKRGFLISFTAVVPPCKKW